MYWGPFFLRNSGAFCISVRFTPTHQILERIFIESSKTKTKVITMTNQKAEKIIKGSR